MTQSERDAWNLYAANVVMSNKLGQPMHLTGQNHFLRANIPRIQSGISVLETAPTVFDLGTFTAPEVLDLHVASQRISLTFGDTDDWASSVNGYLLLWGGRPVNASREYFGGPYRYAGLIQGDPVPPSSPEYIFTSWRLSVGPNYWFYARIIQPDGRLSLPAVIGPYNA